MSYLDWHVGMEVVCIRSGAPHWPAFARKFIVKDRIYTIAGLHESPDEIPVYLSFIGGPVCPDGTQAEYECISFRPIEKRKTDISIFTAMLKGKKETVRA